MEFLKLDHETPVRIGAKLDTGLKHIQEWGLLEGRRKRGLGTRHSRPIQKIDGQPASFIHRQKGLTVTDRDGDAVVVELKGRGHFGR